MHVGGGSAIFSIYNNEFYAFEEWHLKTQIHVVIGQCCVCLNEPSITHFVHVCERRYEASCLHYVNNYCQAAMAM